jgi:hypothetical protein
MSRWHSAILHTPSIASFTLSDLIIPLFARLCINPPLLFPELLQAMLCLPVAKLVLLHAECSRIMRRHKAKAEMVTSGYRIRGVKFFRNFVIRMLMRLVTELGGFGGVRGCQAE